MQTTVAITTLDRLPSQRDKLIKCKLCGAEFPRWQRRIHDDDPRKSGVLLLIAHQLEAHAGDSE